MSVARPSQQLSDLLTYLLIPGTALVMPGSFSRWVIRKTSQWKWFMGAAADLAFQAAREYVEIEDESAWKARWKQVEVLDARDMYMMVFGRTGTVLAEVDSETPLELAKDRAVIGMHWGPSCSILKLLAGADLSPAIPYRSPERHILRIRPFYYLFLRVGQKYIESTLGDRAVPIGGAGKTISALLDQPGSVIVVMDAPPMAGRSTISGQVLGRKASFNAGFPGILATAGKEYVFYAIHLHPDGSIRKELELEGPFSADSEEAFMQRYAAFLDRQLVSDPAHWRIWQAAAQFWKEDL